LDIPALIGAFLQSITVSDTQTVIDQIALLNTLPTEDADADNIVRIVAIGNIIAIMTQDETFDYTGIIDPLFGFVYDVKTAIGSEFLIERDDMVTAINTYLANLATQIDIVVLIDLENLTEQNLIDIYELATIVQDLIGYIYPVIPIEMGD